MDKALLHMIDNDINTYMRVVGGVITAFDMMKCNATIYDVKYNSTKQAYIAAYCIYDNPFKKLKKHLCWYCANNRYGDGGVYQYETIQNTYVHLHKHCYEQAIGYRKKCSKRPLGKYQLLCSNNYHIIYDMTVLYLVVTATYDYVPYNTLITYTKAYPKEKEHQLPYQRLVKKLFIKKYTPYYMLIKQLTFEEVHINTIISRFYIKLYF